MAMTDTHKNYPAPVSPHEIQNPRVDYAAGIDAFVVEGEVAHGKGKRTVRAHVLSAAEIVTLASYLTPVLNMPESRGHAAWHFKNPAREYPCSTCPVHVRMTNGVSR